ncbi:MAG TPA: glycogen synthase GlgA [Kofleriaceae bacterium]|nr:glycogen synthase GlgA [Kofleriaceae bacterium]
MRVLHVASEAAPWAQTGGLADVAGALPAALVEADPHADVGLLMPLYRGVASKLEAAGLALDDGEPVVVRFGAYELAARVRRAGRHRGVALAFLDAPALYDRDGLYMAPGGGDFADNHVRFAALSRAAVDFGEHVFGAAPELIHAHDWQTALAPAYLRLDSSRDAIASVFTVHNLAYQGRVPKHVTAELGLPWSVFSMHVMEAWDQLCLLKGGLYFADRITTVSPTYASEILTPAFGEGLDGFLRHDAAPLVGIVNGIDTSSWEPPPDKAAARAALLEELGWTDDGGPLAIVIARMATQKGVDLIADVVPDLSGLGVRLAVLGAGDRALEDRFRWLAGVFRDHLRVVIGFDVARSRRWYAGADLFLMPSRFEPCGIGQLYAMRYGAVPIVSSVGGLVDTVSDPETGIRFSPVTADALRAAIARGAKLYADRRAFDRVVSSGMHRDSSWHDSARAYLDIYRAALAARR